MKKLILAGAVILGSIGLAGCQPPEETFYFEGKLMKESRIADIIEDRLEQQIGEENGMDIDVDIVINEEREDD